MRVLLLVCVILIFALGLMMVYNTSSAEILDKSLNRSLHQALIRQISYALTGILIAFIILKMRASSLLKLSPFLLGVGFFFLLLVFVPGIGKMRNGAHRWIGVGSFTVQPSELIKLLIPMAFIEWFLHKEHTSFWDFCKIILFVGCPIALVMVEPDNGSAAVMGISLLPLLFISRIPFKYWALPVLILMSVGFIAAIQLPYVRGRLEVYLHPERDIKGKGHQPHQAKIAAGSGGLFGRGPGASLQKLTYLPEAQNDYIAAIFAEEFGFLGMLFLLVLYMLFALGGFSIAMRAKEKEMCHLAMALTFLIAIQAFLNLGVVSGLLPSKGVNLPFFSQGGTSLIANIMGLAILLDIGKHEEKSDIFSRRNRRSSLSCSNNS